MTSGERNPKDSALREWNDGRSELTEALATVESRSDALRKRRKLESYVLQTQLLDWRQHNTGSRACWDGDGWRA